MALLAGPTGAIHLKRSLKVLLFNELLAEPTGAPILNRFLSRCKDMKSFNKFQIFWYFFYFRLFFLPQSKLFSLSACKSKNFLYFCNQVSANRRNATLLRQNS